ncbi:DUF3429 family protein [Aurantiacibacter spongiae]|uniref:DUF3429 family protein n=1 Tax=Aurantiacibacter spongiae TaxID=2488860 RepID=A0A3N5CSB9_9SPHN|nr:DUF3429 family protein [Aurantiacibacter spongiae]RPF71477.1 DUF3429 family protein [Aurantiacibacter spongiae]
MPSPRNDTPDATPPLSVILAYAPVALLALLALAALTGYSWAVPVARVWAAAIFLFLAGVARGLSFFTVPGPQVSQLIIMMGRFGCGLLALVLSPQWAFPILVAGYASVLVYDPHAARHGEAPRFFAGLRPPQIGIALAGLLALSAVALARS